MTRIDLAAVTGGGTSSNTLATPFSFSNTTTTDYQACVEAVENQARQAYPDTRFLWIGPDRNAVPRAVMTLDNMRQQCGLPPR